jgi:hypothetical protein
MAQVRVRVRALDLAPEERLSDWEEQLSYS